MKKDYLSEMEGILENVLDELNPIGTALSNNDYEMRSLDEEFLDALGHVSDVLETVRGWIENDADGEEWPVPYNGLELIIDEDLEPTSKILQKYNEDNENEYGEEIERVSDALQMLDNAIKLTRQNID